MEVERLAGDEGAVHGVLWSHLGLSKAHAHRRTGEETQNQMKKHENLVLFLIGKHLISSGPTNDPT